MALIHFLGLSSAAAQDRLILKADQAQLSFFSSAPLEDIEAVSKSGASAVNLETGELVFKVRNTSFQFDKKLMQEHFNENYMESDRYPLSEFKGEISDVEKLQTDGRHEVEVSGELTMHGVTKPYKTNGTIVVRNGQLRATCAFEIKLADHGIKIPSILGRNIAEQVSIDVQAVYK